MSIIKILPEKLVNQIAAGEVIERPASVVKELVENSLDAGATNVTVEIEESGKSLIKITDNGKGMTREDLQTAVLRHATSKIGEEADLWKIKTMGFRGEALASISSVSRISIKSKIEEAGNGYELNCEGGEILNLQEVGMSTGTQIEVRELFFNTPARRKYLKKDSTELGYITSLLNAMALANPNISFKLMHNGKVASDLMKSSDLGGRISEVFGTATFEAMVPVFYGGSDFKIDGFIGKPAISRASTKHQYFFVNGRPIQHFVMANSIRQAYHSMLMEGKKPVFVINIKIDPALIDVNVHPRKVEIRFEDEQSMIRTMYSCVKAALNKQDLTPKAITESSRYMSDSFPKREDVGVPRFNFGSGGAPSVRPAQAIDFSRKFMKERETGELEREPAMKAIAQVANSYIVAKGDDGLVLIDQHAGHERVRYEELMNQFGNQEKKVQPLLVPLQIEFSSDEVALVQDQMEIFKELGFEIDHFGGNTFNVNAVPVFLAKEDIEGVVKGVLDDIEAQKTPTKFQGKSEEIIHYMSCRSAIKFGQKLDLSEMQALIDQMEKLERPYTCPHGRPTMVNLSLGELEKMFGRK
ncbi:DNA mismatch repair endonuclease MutL [Patescibacteria group bacterium]|nr:DNA mismatch repair endonuclease MutL [Patescibacteria group bacterium]